MADNFFEGTIEAHSKRMKYLSQWGTQVEIMAAATLLKAEIYVFTQESGTPKYHWLRYKPNSQQCTVNKCSEEVQKLDLL